MTKSNVSENQAIDLSNETHNQTVNTSESSRFGALYGRDSQQAVDIDMLTLLHTCFGLTEKSQDSVYKTIIVSIDLEGRQNIPDDIREVGISTFDIGELKRMMASEKKHDSDLPSIYSYNFKVRPKPDDFRKPRVDQPFIFGESVTIEHDEIVNVIQQVYGRKYPEKYCTDKSNVVVTGHSFFSDQALLALNRIYLPGLQILDTCGLSRYLYKNKTATELPEDFQLCNMLQHLEIQGDHFHVAGNDSNFTLKLLLMLAVTASKSMDLSTVQRKTMSTLEQISHAPWPAFFWKSKRELAQANRAHVESRRKTYKDKHVELFDEDGDDAIGGLFSEPD